MKSKSLNLSVILRLIPLVVPMASRAAAPTGTASMDALVSGNSTFAVNMYHELGITDGNLFFSPYSISTALGMTYAGAQGNTADEMARALNFTLDQADLKLTFKALSQALMTAARKTEQKLSIANGLCLTGGDVSKEFKALFKENYDAELFAGGLDKINGWGKLKTEGKIEKILDRLDPNSVCVLLNAIYFKGVWESPFKARHTRDAPFKLSSSKEALVPLMYQKGKYRRLSKETFQAAVLPYTGNNLSMVVLLPRDVDGLKELEKLLTSESLRQWFTELDKQSPQEIELFMPKFTLATGYDLVPPCKILGIKDAFDPTGKADFSGMGWTKGDLWISQIKHKAFVVVNEEGTEAAAATAVEMATRSIQQYPTFRADHPFLFLIRDAQSNSILFMGRISDPRNTK